METSDKILEETKTKVEIIQRTISDHDTDLCSGSTSLSKTELRLGANINTPIIHKPYYQGERQLFGYDPSFQPNTVSFDRSNRPYIRTTGTSRPVIQMMCKCGTWVESNFLKALPLEFKNHEIMTGCHQEERIVFGRDGDMYTIAHVIKPKYAFFLFHSSDRGVTWKSYQLPFHTRQDSLTFEYTGLDGNYVGVPLIFVRIPGGKAAVVSFTKSNDTTLNKPDVFNYGTKDTYNVGLHSGPPNPGIRIKNKVHIVWASTVAIDIVGTPQYVTTIDLVTKEILPPVYLGSTGAGDKPDNHNVPSIVYDGETLHVVLGTHDEQFQYFQSTTPNSTRTWTSGKKIGRPKPEPRYASYTYVGLVVDKDKTLHLVSRFSGDEHYFELVYMRKLFNESWSEHKVLVKPFKSYYGVWYHKVSIDRSGRLFVSYKYYGDQMTQEAVDVYHKRWPESPTLIKGNDRLAELYGIYDWKNIQAHDPVILISDDKGDNFRIATSKDFINGFISDEIIKPEKRSADVNKDGTVGMGDLAKVFTNWGKCDDECEADIDRDGKVGISDVSIVLVNWDT